MDKFLAASTVLVIEKQPFLLSYVKEANELQLKKLVTEGIITSRRDFSESEKKQIESKYSELKEKYGEVVFEKVNMKSVLGIILFNPINWMIWRGLQNGFRKAARKCANYTFSVSRDRDVCLMKAKIDDDKKKLQYIKTILVKDCKLRKKPEAVKKCLLQVKKAEAKIQKRLAKHNEKLTKLVRKAV